MNTAATHSKAHMLRRVFVWELPVRVYHWINALCILGLIGTGIIIGNPPAILSGKEAYAFFWFGTVRFIHFVAAYVFMFNFLFRIYWGFVGNKYASWNNFIPTNKQFFSDMWNVIKTDIFMTKAETNHSIGHNRLAGFIYFLTFIAFAIQCLTGFGLYSATSDWWLPSMFTWVPPLFGGDFFLRVVHHWAMWFFILFAVVHVYLVFYHDYVEGRGEISSIGGGWKFIDEEVFNKNHPGNEPKK
ncbi:MAG: Ni/Fe-hydrogenase, b-type cytochrome subunit [Cyclobacteriaceae bacterium]|nr:Ni/Fe-hydrogenase, b-type cytochrome subunit [Cyclobacteriaceae bacterium]